jgi:hypothetical protein
MKPGLSEKVAAGIPKAPLASDPGSALNARERAGQLGDACIMRGGEQDQAQAPVRPIHRSEREYALSYSRLKG